MHKSNPYAIGNIFYVEDAVEHFLGLVRGHCSVGFSGVGSTLSASETLHFLSRRHMSSGSCVCIPELGGVGHCVAWQATRPIFNTIT